MLRSHERALDRMMERATQLFPEYGSPLSMIDGFFDTLEKRVDGEDVTYRRYKLVPVEMEEWTCPECGHTKLKEKDGDSGAETSEAA